MADIKTDVPYRTKMNESEIDEELIGTFPASDPPSWTLGLDPDRASMKVMRIHAYGGPEQLHFDNAPVPHIAEDQVLVRLAAASVNPIDCKLASGALRPVMGNKAVALPWIPGGDFAGTVEKIGEAVSGIKKGDDVYGNCPGGGAYAQFVAAKFDTVAPKPRKLSFTQAAAVPIAAQTAWQGLFDHGHLESGQTVLIHGGSGGVGSFAIQLARWKKAKVCATGSSQHIEYLRHLGADQAIDYTTTAFDTSVKDVDLVLDLIGGETQERSFKIIKPGGRLVTAIGLVSPQTAEKDKINAMMMSMKPSRQLLAKLGELLDEGAINVNLTKVYPLLGASEAWKEILSHHTKGKIVLEI